MVKLRRIAAEEPLRALARDGWAVSGQRGSHVKLRHPAKQGGVTVPRHAGEIIKPKTLVGILNQAGLTAEELRRLL